jgi:hypothetical protein
MAAHLIDVINAVMLVKGHAQVFGKDHPEHTENVQSFLQELDRITIELKSAVYGNKA